MGDHAGPDALNEALRLANITASWFAVTPIEHAVCTHLLPPTGRSRSGR